MKTFRYTSRVSAVLVAFEPCAENMFLVFRLEIYSNRDPDEKFWNQIVGCDIWLSSMTDEDFKTSNLELKAVEKSILSLGGFITSHTYQNGLLVEKEGLL